MKLTIRYAEPGDASVLAQLMCELGYETTATELPRWLCPGNIDAAASVARSLPQLRKILRRKELCE